jgi:alpha-tubulin suppressor-like RCC1 family protein
MKWTGCVLLLGIVSCSGDATSPKQPPPPPNQAPTARSGVDQDVTTGDTVRLDGTQSSDPDGNSLNFSWNLLEKPANSSAVLISANTPSPSLVPDTDGRFRVVLTVSDGSASASDTIEVRSSFLFSSISAGELSTCGVLRNGRVYCWRERPLRVPSGNTFRAVTAGGALTTGVHACGVTNDGMAYCWGDNGVGQLGNGTRSNTTQPIPSAVSGGLSFSSVAAGGAHTCGLTNDGIAYCWGDNVWGQLGNGTSLSSTIPVPVAGGLRFRELALHVVGSCGLTHEGARYCWGANRDYSFGSVSAPSSSTVPVRVIEGQAWATVQAGQVFGSNESACGVTIAGDAFCWGWRGYKLGSANPCSGETCADPVRVSGTTKWVVVDAGGDFSCGLTTTGDTYCWGNNSNGQLGTSISTTCSNVGFPSPCSAVPVQINNSLRFTQISTGGQHSCAVTEQGEAYCWGRGLNTGTGSTADRLTPTRVLPPG